MFMHRGEGVGRVEDLLEDSANRTCIKSFWKIFEVYLEKYKTNEL